MRNPWLVPVWLLFAVMIMLNALQFMAMHTSALLPVTLIFIADFLLWAFVAFKCARYKY